jgi:hypothetical protein
MRARTVVCVSVFFVLIGSTYGCWRGRAPAGASPDGGDADGDADGDGDADTDTDAEPSPLLDGIELDWARSFGGEEYEMGFWPLALEQGGMMLGGFFGGEVVVGQGEPNETVLTASGEMDAYLARVESGGSLRWVTTAGGGQGDLNGMENVSAFAEYPDGSLGVCGDFVPGTVLGAGEPNETVLQIDASLGTFLARYEPDGSLRWARAIVGKDLWTSCSGCIELSSGGVLVTGRVGFEVTLGSGQPGETIFEFDYVEESGDFFAAVFDAEGDLDWARSIGSTDVKPAWGGVAAVDGGFAVSGVLQSGATFDDGSGGTVEIEVGEKLGVFLARFDEKGELLWLRTGLMKKWWMDSQVGDPEVYIPVLAATPDGGVLMAGSYSYTVDWEDGSGGFSTLGDGVAEPRASLYVVKYDAQGQIVFARTLCKIVKNNMIPSVTTLDLEVIPGGAALICGDVIEDTVFFPQQPELEKEVELGDGSGNTDVWIIAIDSAGEPRWLKLEGGGAKEQMRLALLADGSLGFLGDFYLNNYAPNGSETVLGVGDPNQTSFESSGSGDVFYGRYVAKSD